MGKRRRGTAIFETEKGILLTSISGRTFILPGGGANKGESRFRAAIRELEEETGLMANYAKIIFRHESYSQEHTVVLVKAEGTPKPKNEVKHLDYFKPGKNIKISKGTKEIIKKYYEWKIGALPN
ncbi:MAG: 8-oxo-dGTP diphosphatase [Candidatus Woesearchaeota archaeon]|nr:8-oxo-dGTP diphosphatase [Candidatus Woesearchaeota archaeon]